MTTSFSTLPVSFAESLLTGARRNLAVEQIEDLLREAGIGPGLLTQRGARVTRGQFVRLYRVVALATGDEMLGLWSRPIKGGGLKYLGLSLLDASSVLAAMYRFTHFWNLLLDDYRLDFKCQDGTVRLALNPLIGGIEPIPFGHELMVKLSHGIASWLVGHELPILSVGFGFSAPGHFDEYAQLFPGPVTFDHDGTFICFQESLLRRPFQRSRGELLQFVKRAPDDWIFVTFDRGLTMARVRGWLVDLAGRNASLDEAAAALSMSNRTLSRRLAAEQTSFQKMKDDLRRDLAVEKLVTTRKSIEEIASLVGFNDTAAFYRAFQTWTGSTPRTYRRSALARLT